MIADVSVDELIFAAALACKRNVEQEPIDKAICDAPGADASELDRYKETKFVPFDPTRKRTEATLCGPDGSVFSVSKGSPQVICDLVDDKEMRARVLAVVDEYAARGFRTLGVARTKKGRDDSSWEFLGVLSLYDPPRHDTADTVVNAMALGNEVKMITGDHIAIAKETAPPSATRRPRQLQAAQPTARRRVERRAFALSKSDIDGQRLGALNHWVYKTKLIQRNLTEPQQQLFSVSFYPFVIVIEKLHQPRAVFYPDERGVSSRTDIYRGMDSA